MRDQRKSPAGGNRTGAQQNSFNKRIVPASEIVRNRCEVCGATSKQPIGNRHACANCEAWHALFERVSPRSARSAR